MNYIEQLLPTPIAKKLWLYLPFPVFFIGMLFFNAVFLAYNQTDTNAIIEQGIAAYGKNMFFLQTVLPMALFFFVLLFWVKMVQKQSLLSLVTSRKKVDWSRILFAFSVWAGITLIVFFYNLYTEPQNYQWNFNGAAFFPFLIMALVLIPLQTSFEELLMRGYLIQGIGLASRSRFLALFVTSIIFGLMHISNPEVGKIGYYILIYYIGTGFFLGILTLMDDGLELALGFHAANNLIGALLVTSNWTAFQTNSLFIEQSAIEESLPISTVLIQVGIVLPLLLLLFAKVYRWTDWRNKLTGRVG
ncbi:CPBP family intramembrane glutamic endopeptidase [Flavobacterium sp. NKUCC04_CG]|uniref:CPBP family intramembrane glutamic endopeptidase n=1 Tax=Flavobacterium sp. NKUCC04_CG TaxID=2842121 RepID=UPI001C5AC155|nr:CPBP family intramembrane glutamic endopeptidase [Flavobacterium sp. NKUCC04_CG]MBW3520450.1 CPBP family intramembrane metalloprotease [Flavobacterium sp. NKUCC04_CG]